jgi:hypothetical protein
MTIEQKGTNMEEISAGLAEDGRVITSEKQKLGLQIIERVGVRVRQLHAQGIFPQLTVTDEDSGVITEKFLVKIADGDKKKEDSPFGWVPYEIFLSATGKLEYGVGGFGFPPRHGRWDVKTDGKYAEDIYELSLKAFIALGKIISERTA